MTMDFHSFLMTSLAALATAIGAMAAWFRAQFNHISVKLDDCESDREDLWTALAENGIRRPAHPARHRRKRGAEPESGEEA